MFMKYFLIFCFIWWILFFMILPVGITTNRKVPKGFIHGTPLKPRILQKFIITTLISASFVLILVYFAHKGYIDRNIFR